MGWGHREDFAEVLLHLSLAMLEKGGKNNATFVLCCSFPIQGLTHRVQFSHPTIPAVRGR